MSWLREAALAVRGSGGKMSGDNKEKDQNVIDQICSPDSETRLSAAKELPKVDDPSAPDALVRLLEDEDLSVRWTAMQNLVSSGRKAIEPLLVALTHDFQSNNLRQGAKHIFQTLHEFGMLNPAEVSVLRKLEKSTHAVQVADAANRALLANMRMSNRYSLKKYSDLQCK
jgi:hypothetical protein